MYPLIRFEFTCHVRERLRFAFILSCSGLVSIMEEKSFDTTIRRFATGARVSDTVAQNIPINRESDSD